MKDKARKLPLHRWHRARGAELAARRGSLVPCHYGRAIEEYQTLRSGVGLLDRSSIGRLEIRDQDRQRFLNGLVTCNVAELRPGAGAYGFLTAPRGQILADVCVLCLEDRLWLELPGGTASALLLHLEKYVVADRVTIGPLDAMVPLTLLGSEAANMLVSLAPAAAGSLRKPWAHTRAELLGTEVVLARRELLGVPAFTLWASEGIAEILADELVRGAGVRPVGYEAWETLRIEGGVPLFGVDFGVENLPQETGLEEAVRYDKGCYLGQEIIARLHYRGQVPRQLRTLLFEDPGEQAPLPEPGAELLYEGRAAGVLTSVTRSLALGRTVGLGMLQRRAFFEGARVELAPALAAVVTATPAVPALAK